MCLHCLWQKLKISLRLVQLNLLSLGTKEIFLAIVLWLVDRKRPGYVSFLKCVVRNVILSIDAHFIVAHYYSFVCYKNVRVFSLFSLKRLDRLGASVR